MEVSAAKRTSHMGYGTQTCQIFNYIYLKSSNCARIAFVNEMKCDQVSIYKVLQKCVSVKTCTGSSV